MDVIEVLGRNLEMVVTDMAMILIGQNESRGGLMVGGEPLALLEDGKNLSLDFVWSRLDWM